MKFVSKMVALVVTALLSVSAFATDTATKVVYKANGVPTAQAVAGATTLLSIGPVVADKASVGIAGIAAVWKTAPDASFGATALQSEDGAKGTKDWVLTYGVNPLAFAGARQCILKRGVDWPGTADLKSLKLDDPKVVCVPITGNDGTYSVDVAGDYNVLGLVPVIEFKDGSRAWGSHPFGQSRSKNVKGQTITLLEVTRDADNKAVKVSAASSQAKAFFRGRFQ